MAQQLVGKEAPFFTRDSTRGPVTSHDGSGNHPHVLVFCPSPEMPECRSYLDALVSDREEFDEIDAQVVVITPAGAETAASSLPLPIISQAKDLFEQFGMVDEQRRPRLGVVTVDRYGVVDSCFVATRVEELPKAHLIATRLSQVESQCPECGVPEALWADVG